MSRFRFVLAAILCGIALSPALADDVTLDAVPPVVVKTVPTAGTTAVDSTITEIRITFSKDMLDQSWSWTTVSKESFPKTTGKPKFFDDKRTCVLPVKLEAGKTYGIWVNSAKQANFKDAKGRPAVPYLLVFQTKTAYQQNVDFAEKMLAVLALYADALESVKDMATAKAAAKRIDAATDRMTKLLESKDRIPQVPAADKQKLDAKYKPRLKAAAARMQKVAFSAGTNSGGEPDFLAAIKRMQALGQRFQKKRAQPNP